MYVDYVCTMQRNDTHNLFYEAESPRLGGGDAITSYFLKKARNRIQSSRLLIIEACFLATLTTEVIQDMS